MFCSVCGKTLMPEDQNCPHCGSPVGESRFEGMSYTSAQPHVLPGAQPMAVMAPYTRTSYSTMPEEQQEQGGVDGRTTYRPLYDGKSAPEEVREDMRAAFAPVEQPEEPQEEEAPEHPQEPLSEEAISTLNAVDEELRMDTVDTSGLEARPITSSGRAGISEGVNDYIQKLEASQSRRAARRRRAYDDGEDAYTAPTDDQPVYGDDPAGEPPLDDDQSEVFDDVNEDEMDELRYGRVIGVKEILRVAVIMVVAAALIVGVVLWVRYFRSAHSNAKIAGVSQTLYTDGVELIKSRTENTYINELINLYRSEGSLALATRVTNDSAAIDALMPQEPAANDALFVSALQKIQSNIGNAVLMDGVEADAGNSNSEESQARWSIVNNSLAQLEAATTVQELTAILNGEQITVATSPTPTPMPEELYSTLSKGDKSDAVLEMQNRLYMLGFLLDDRDGAFGSKTQTAVKSFQQAAGLPVTGIADNATLTLLYSDDAPRTALAQETPTPAPTATPEPEEVPAADGATGEV